MSEVDCPYCGLEQEINHDNGYGYEEGQLHEQECPQCERIFKFETSISFHYQLYCDGEHDMEQCPVEEHKSLWECSRCDHYEVRK